MDLFLFEPLQVFLLVISFTLACGSILCIEIRQNYRVGLFLLLMAGLSGFLFSATLDPFLNYWDEQFHALVAKNLIEHPLKPTLYPEAHIPYDYTNWTANHVWLHKQPLFLWQMALSIKLFGVNELAVRLPSVLMMSLIPIFIYRIGKHSLNAKAGFYGALLFSTSYFAHELVAGAFPSEHNDTAFLFYITASIWALTEYEHSKKFHWLLLTGLFSGCAVLVKWLAGLLVFSGWGLSVLLIKERRTSFISYRNILLSFTICLMVFLSWQLYISAVFPVESAHEFSLNTKHFNTVVEGHSGDAWFYIMNLYLLYGGGDLIPYVLLISLFFLFREMKNSFHRICFVTFILIVYLFFSIAATKMVAFCFIVSPLIFLSLGNLINVVIGYVRARARKSIVIQGISVLALLVIAFANLDLHKIAHRHTMYVNPNDNNRRLEKLADTRFIKALPSILPEKSLIFNCKGFTYVPIMFYTGLTAYNRIPTYDEYINLRKLNYKIAIIENAAVPKYLLKDPAILKIPAPGYGWN